MKISEQTRENEHRTTREAQRGTPLGGKFHSILFRKLFIKRLCTLAAVIALCAACAGTADAQEAQESQEAQKTPGAQVFRYRFMEGDSYRINSTVRETVYVNRRYSHSAEITNRITVDVSDARTGAAPEETSALNTCTFMTSERNSTGTFTWGREYESVFRQNALGVYDIGEEYFMPTVRNVPTFPIGAVKPGETWTGTGEEAHDLRGKFALQTPYRIPFTVTYTYKGPVTDSGKTLHHIEAEYTMSFKSPQAVADYPVATRGWSRQQIFWDNELGLCPRYSEEFRIQLELLSGEVIEYKGTARAELTETKLMERDRIVQEMNDEISRLGIPNVNAQSTDEGITISIENIQFDADSSRLLPSEKFKIQKLAALLERYPDRELLITGHTALAGTEAARLKLSEERASAVARYLAEIGVREEYNLYTRGFGAEKPLVPNTTEANRARNRRVEITILEK
ncbi:MAG: Peptidoglycan-binding protein ArfA [Spirochaetes bacterium ADurb.Bin269]|nr:MAG: Peptidoglycan-binding protein ArfA [Spirochaetes bacterium ADurb.Bin269]